MPDFLKRTWAEVNLDDLEHNFLAIRRYIRRGCKIMAIVKADAYGHGAPYVARLYHELGSEYFGVSNIEEAKQLRDSGISEPILVLGYTPASMACELSRLKVIQTVGSLSYAQSLSSYAGRSGSDVKIHIKLDTGMSRIGFLCHSDEEIEKSACEIVKAADLPGLDAEGVFTHFAVSDEPSRDFTKVQFSRFKKAIDSVGEKGLHFKVRHCCNSAGLLNFPKMQLDMVRPGIILYGLAPSDGMSIPIDLRPAMTVKTVISHLKKVPAGVAISYGMTYVTKKESIIATLPIGYADGYSRSLSNRGRVFIAGKPAPIIGRICMDQCMVDVSGIPEVYEGQTVTVMGPGGVSIDETAKMTGTINYEVACLIGKRVPRIYLRGGKETGVLNYIDRTN